MTECAYAVDLKDTSDAQEAVRTHQCNFIAFAAARLTQSGLADHSEHIPDFRATFEEPDQRSKAYLKQGPQLDVHVPLAGIWILLCENVIFAHCRNLVAHDYNDAGKNWKGANRFSIERWIFWKRFGKIKVHDQASEKTKELAAEGEGLMNRIESEAN